MKHWSFQIILDRHFSQLLVYMEKNEFSLCGILECFLEKKLPPQINHVNHDHDHHWVDLAMA